MMTCRKLDVAEPATLRLCLEQLAKLDFLEGRGALPVPVVQVATLAAEIARQRGHAPQTQAWAFASCADFPTALYALIPDFSQSKYEERNDREREKAYLAYCCAVATVQRDVAAPDGTPLRLWAIEEPVYHPKPFKPKRWDKALDDADATLKRLARLAGLGDLV